MVDESTLNLIRSELDAGKKPEELIPKLRKLGYSDKDIETIFAQLLPKKITLISRPSRTTILKTIFSPTVLIIVVVLMILVGGIYYLTTVTFQPESLEEKAKSMIESTPEVQLFLQAIELQNAIISCIPQFDPGNSKLAFCTITISKKLEDLGNGEYKMIYTIDEDSRCPKNYIKQNEMLEVEVDLMTTSTSTRWIKNPMFKTEIIQSLYPKRNNCNQLQSYVPVLIEEIT